MKFIKFFKKNMNYYKGLGKKIRRNSRISVVGCPANANIRQKKAMHTQNSS